jgi:hypothetical protein
MRRARLAPAPLLVACAGASHPAPSPARNAAPVIAPDAAVVDAAITHAAPPCRRDLPPAPTLDLADDATLAPMTEDTSPALAAACRRLAARTAARFASLRRGDNTPAASGSALGLCMPAGRGAWAFEITALRVGPVTDNVQTWPGRWRLVYLDPTGRTIPSSEEHNLDLHGQGSLIPQLTWIVDVDHDGIGEIHFVSANDFGEETFVNGRWVMQSRDGVIRPFAPLHDVESEHPADVDGDGHVDFLVSPPYRIPHPGLRDDQTLTGLSMLLHGRPDLTWTRDDELAREYVRQRCAAIPVGPPYYRDATMNGEGYFDDFAGRVSCARFRGVSVDAIERTLRTEVNAVERDAAQVEFFDTSTLAATLTALRPEAPFAVEARCADASDAH